MSYACVIFCLKGMTNMDSMRKRWIFLLSTGVLAVVLVVAVIVTLMQGPRESTVELISQTDTEYIVDDLYEGQMSIPKFQISGSSYKPDDFVEKRGIVTYEGGDSWVGINVNQKKGEIDWAQVAANGVDYAMIRVGYRNYGDGRLMPDTLFEENIKGATEAGLPVGVYFYSKAVTDAEAEEEATYVLEQIRTYNITYPVVFYWEYDLKEDGSLDQDSRTKQCNGDQVTGFVDTFCKKVKAASYTAGFYCDKTMGYEKLDLEKLSGYEMWYAEFRTVPSFFYDFGMWQYTKEGTVPGISEKVPISLALKKYE